jgi:hypothetical protein
MRARAILFVMLVSTAALPLAAQADLYKWVDENGVVNYGDKPPGGAAKATKLDEADSSLSVVPGLSKEEIAFYREGLAQSRADRQQREIEELRTRSTAPPPSPVPEYDTYPVVYGGAYWPIHDWRHFVNHPAQLPVKGTPVHKTPPFRSMRAEVR